MTESDADDLDLRLLHALEIDGRAPFSRIAEVLGVSDQTVARRFRRLRQEAGLRVMVLRDADRLGRDTWALRLRCAPGAAEEIARALARRPDTSWIALMSGGTEVVCMTAARTRGEHDELVLGKLPRTPGILEIGAYQRLHRFYGGPAGWISKHGMLTPAEQDALRPPGARPATPVRITAEDCPLLDALRADGRAGYPELSRITGRSESAVKRRLGQLLCSGSVFTDTEYLPEQLGFRTRAILWISARPAALDRVGAALAAHAEVSYAGATTGPSNLLAVVVTRDTQRLYAYLSGRLGALDGVEHVDTAPVLRAVKQLTYRERPAH